MFCSQAQRVESGLWDSINRRRTGVAGDPAVLRCGGRGATPLNLYGDSDVEAVTSRGLTVLAGSWTGPTHWAKPTALTAFGDGKTYIQSDPWSAAAGPVGSLAESMGTLLAILYALANPTHISAMALALPLVDFLAFYSENRGGFASEISTARGGAPDSTVDPMSRAADIAALDIPIKLWASSDDTLTPLDEAQAFATAVGAECVDMGAVGHATYDAFAAEAADFLAAHA